MTSVPNQQRSLPRNEYERRTSLPQHSRHTSGTDVVGLLAGCLHAQIKQANPHVERPGGMSYLLPSPVPREIIASILFQAIAPRAEVARAKLDT